MKGKRNQTTAALPAVPSKKNRAWKTFRNNKTLLLMCLPAVIFFIVFNYCPLPGVWIAFTSYNFRDGIFGSPFVGLSNFEFLISSGELWTLTKNTILYNLVFILLGNVFQIVIALMLNEIRSKFFKKVSQTIMFLPYFISAVLIGAIAFNILNYDTGALNALLRETGADPIQIYSKAGLWPFIIIFCNMWQQTGYGSVVYFAAICGIDSSMVEAAEVDGATSWQSSIMWNPITSMPYLSVSSCGMSEQESVKKATFTSLIFVLTSIQIWSAGRVFPGRQSPTGAELRIPPQLQHWISSGSARLCAWACARTAAG